MLPLILALYASPEERALIDGHATKTHGLERVVQELPHVIERIRRMPEGQGPREAAKLRIVDIEMLSPRLAHPPGGASPS